jgi:ABC-2 type transport system ATP-binding protein
MTQENELIRLTGVAKSFGGVRAVTGLDMAVRAGETVALLGPNGAGKSTTIAMLLNLVRPDAGEVTLFGGPSAAAVQAGRVGVMLQGGELPSYATVAELVELARAIFPRPLPSAEILDTAGLAGLTTRRVDKLSGGQHQRAKFAFALAGDPELLVLDEPTAGMDATARQRFWEAVRALTTGAPCCSPRTTWPRLTSTPTAS